MLCKRIGSHWVTSLVCIPIKQCSIFNALQNMAPPTHSKPSSSKPSRKPAFGIRNHNNSYRGKTQNLKARLIQNAKVKKEYFKMLKSMKQEVGSGSNAIFIESTDLAPTMDSPPPKVDQVALKNHSDEGIKKKRLGNKSDPFLKVRCQADKEKQERAMEKQRKEQELKENRKGRNKYYRERQQKFQKMNRSNDRGQPSLNTRMNFILEKLEKNS